MKKIHIFLVIICIVSFIRFFIIVVGYKNYYYEIEKKFIGKIVNINASDDKTILDIKERKKYRVTVYKKLNYNLGDKVLVSGIFYTPSYNTVFNLFNYRKYLLSKKIYMISDNPNIKIISKNKNILYEIKNIMIKRINTYDSRSYLKRFLIGDGSEMDSDIKDLYQKIGISHLFSISGMHVGYIILIFNLIFKKFKYKEIIIILFLVFFLFITNFSESLIRCTLFYILNFINKSRKLNIKNTYILWLTFFILLFYNPFLIYSVGFLFSIIITFYILLYSKKISNKKGYFKKLLCLSVVSFLASVPILAFNFFKINFLSIIYNLIFIPIISFVIFPFSLITFVFPFLDGFYLLLINILEASCKFVSRFDFLTVVISKPNVIFLLIYYFSLYLSIKVNRKFLAVFLIFLMINISSKFFIISPEVTFLDQRTTNMIPIICRTFERNPLILGNI